MAVENTYFIIFLQQHENVQIKVIFCHHTLNYLQMDGFLHCHDTLENSFERRWYESTSTIVNITKNQPLN